MDELMDLAESLGRDHGKAAGSWVFDGNTDADTMRKAIQWNDDGDPQFEEFEPSLPDVLPGDLVRAMKEADAEDRELVLGDAYELAFRDAATAELIGYAERMTSE